MMNAIVERHYGGVSEWIQHEHHHQHIPTIQKAEAFFLQCDEIPYPHHEAGHACYYLDLGTTSSATSKFNFNVNLNPLASLSLSSASDVHLLGMAMTEDDCVAMAIAMEHDRMSSSNSTSSSSSGFGVRWMPYSCEEAHTFYGDMTKQTTEMSMTKQLQLDIMASSVWEPICCHEQDHEQEMQESSEIDMEFELESESELEQEIQEFWWNSMQPWREGHSKYLIIIKGFMSIVSVLCSTLLVYILFFSPDGLSTTQNRLLMGLCLADISFSLPQCFFGMMLPMELDYFSWNARGNMITCQVQGFFTAFGGICGQAYNASLCLNYLAIVKYEKSAEYIQSKIEPYLHAVPLIIATTWCTIAVTTGKINPDGQGCCLYNDYFPPHCWDEGYAKDDHTYADFASSKDFDMNFNIDINAGVFDIPCKERDRSPLAVILTICTLLYIITPPFVMGVSLTMIYRTVRQQETKVAKYGRGSLSINLDTVLVLRELEKNKGTDTTASTNATTSSSISGTSFSSRALDCWHRLKESLGCSTCACKCGQSESKESSSTESLQVWKLKKSNSKRRSRRQSRSVMYKGVAYSCSWFLTWILYIVAMILAHFFSVRMKPTTLLYMIHIFMPLQGVYNLTIYMYPKVISIKRGSTSRTKSKSKSINDNENDNLTWWQALVSAFRTAFGGKQEPEEVRRRRSRHKRLSAKLRNCQNRPSECSKDKHNPSMSMKTKTDMGSSIKSLTWKLKTSLEKVKCKQQARTTKQCVNHLSFGSIRSSRSRYSNFESDAYSMLNMSTCKSKIGDEPLEGLDTYFCGESSLDADDVADDVADDADMEEGHNEGN